MAIGVNWKEIWKPVWKAVWSNTAPEPVVSDSLFYRYDVPRERRAYVVPAEPRAFTIT